MRLISYPVTRAVRPLQAIDRLFDEAFRGFESRPPVVSTRSRQVPVDLFEDDENIVARFEIPGVGKKDLSISLEQDVLTLEAHREAKDDKTARELRFRRQVRLPVDVVSEKAKADLRDGILTITLPKAEAAKARSIKIN